MDKKFILKVSFCTVSFLTMCLSGFGQDFSWLGDWKFSVEVKGNYRSSDQNAFPQLTPFAPNELPLGANSAFLETVDEGEHFEVSLLSFSLSGPLWSENLQANIKIDTIDLYDRNPTSGDREVDLDVGWIRYGKKYKARQLPEGNGFYAQIGKFEKFERQNDRHLESYGLVSTTFNRFEDAGIEFGGHIGSNFYYRASWTTGNPVFFRDPNALAGDNGTDDRRTPPDNPDPDLKSGILVLYNAEIEDFDLSDNPEYGFGLGFRLGDLDQQRRINFMVWGYNRNLDEEPNLGGTFYDGDIDLLNGVGPFTLPITDDERSSIGANLWIYYDNLTFFGQFVDQDLAGLDRQGVEFELSYFFGLPQNIIIDGNPLFSFIAPAIRYSSLKNDFVGSPFFPGTSVWWDWEKYDIGVKVGIYKGFHVTLEYSLNEFEVGSEIEENNEFLTTFRYRHRFN